MISYPIIVNLLGCLSFHQGALPNEPASAKFMQIDDTRIRYDVRGKGNTIVMLHGFASSMEVWDRLTAELEDEYQIVRLDLKGFGWTDRPEGDYSPQAQSELVWELLDKLKIDHFSLVGHSWGSSVALQMALDKPDRINRVALYDAWVYEEQLPAFFVWSRSPVFGETMFRLWYKERAEDRLAMAFYDPEKWVNQGFIEAVDSALDRPATVTAALAAVRAQQYEKIQHRYSEIGIPVLLIWGEEDQVAPLWVAHRLASELPYSQLETYGSCGHFPMIEAYGPSTFALQAFLEAGEE